MILGKGGGSAVGLVRRPCASSDGEPGVNHRRKEKINAQKVVQHTGSSRTVWDPTLRRCVSEAEKSERKHGRMEHANARKRGAAHGNTILPFMVLKTGKRLGPILRRFDSGAGESERKNRWKVMAVSKKWRSARQYNSLIHHPSSIIHQHLKTLRATIGEPQNANSCQCSTCGAAHGNTIRHNTTQHDTIRMRCATRTRAGK